MLDRNSSERLRTKFYRFGKLAVHKIWEFNGTEN